MADLLRSAIQLWETIYRSKVATVKFTKKLKEGQTVSPVRIMKCTLDFTKIPKTDHPKTPLNMAKILKLMQNSKIIHVYDLEKGGWRSIPFENVDWAETTDENGKTKLYKIAPYK